MEGAICQRTKCHKCEPLKEPGETDSRDVEGVSEFEMQDGDQIDRSPTEQQRYSPIDTERCEYGEDDIAREDEGEYLRPAGSAASNMCLVHRGAPIGQTFSCYHEADYHPDGAHAPEQRKS